MAYILQEYYDTDDSTLTVVYGANWRCQTFTDAGGFDLTRVSIKAYRVGTPGDVTMDIMATTAGKPSGAVLGTVDVSANAWTEDTGGDWYNFDFSPAVTVPAATMYAIVLSIPAGDAANHIRWRDDAAGASYAGGTYDYSGDSGGTWTISSGGDLMFRTYSTGVEYEDLAGTASGTLTPVGALALGVALLGTASGTVTAVGSIFTGIAMVGTASITFSSVGTLTFGPLSGVKSEKQQRRLITIGNDAVYYEDID